MTGFRIGERVELFTCTDFPGIVTGLVRGKVLVRFDDFANEDSKPFRPDSLQLVGKQARPSYGVPKTVASGTQFQGIAGLEE